MADTEQIKLKPAPRFVIGVDPGAATGVAVYNRHAKKLDFFKTMTFWKFYDYVETIRVSPAWKFYLFVIETPNSKRPVYARRDDVEGANRREKVAANIGSNRREAELLADGIERLGFAVRRVTPTHRKWSAVELKKYTGIDGRTSQHVRDAIALCWQM